MLYIIFCGNNIACNIYIDCKVVSDNSNRLGRTRLQEDVIANLQRAV